MRDSTALDSITSAATTCAPCSRIGRVVPRIDLIIFVTFVVVLVFILSGCDLSEYDRLQAAADQRDRIARACTPEEGQRITVALDGDSIHFTYIDIGPGRYSRSFPHAEVRIATIEDGS